MHESGSYTVALTHEQQHGETQTQMKNPILSPFHRLNHKHMAVYIHIH